MIPDEITGRNWDPNEPFHELWEEIIMEKTDGWETTVEKAGQGSGSNKPIPVDRLMWYLRDIQSELARIKVALSKLSEHLGVRDEEW